MRVIHETARGCGYRVDGGCYLVADMSVLGTLPSCVEIDPPIPINEEVIPFTRGVYLVDLSAVLTEEDQRTWLVGTSKESLRQRDDASWEIERYGMRLSIRLRTGICAGIDPVQAEQRLAELKKSPGTFISDYILAINRAGRGRRVARETAVMQKSMRERDWPQLLAACWRLAGYEDREVRNNLKRIMVSIGATGDAIYI